MINYPSYMKGRNLQWLRKEFLYAVMHMLLIDKRSPTSRDLTHAFKLGCSFQRCVTGVNILYKHNKINVYKDLMDEVHRLNALEHIAPPDNV